MKHIINFVRNQIAGAFFFYIVFPLAIAHELAEQAFFIYEIIATE